MTIVAIPGWNLLFGNCGHREVARGYFPKPTQVPIRISWAIGLGNCVGINAMTERVVAGIAVTSIIASLSYIALALIG